MNLFSAAARCIGVVANWFWTIIDGSLLHKGIARVLYYPTLLVISLLRGPQWHWYDRIDSTVICGALPLRNQTRELVEQENVRAVISYMEPFELRFFTNKKEEWKRSGVEQSEFSTIDYQAPSLMAIQKGLRMVYERKKRNESVYIHCKAGRGRSAVVTACYLVKDYDCTPEGAIEFLRSKRPQILINPRQRRRVMEFYEHLGQEESSSEATAEDTV